MKQFNEKSTGKPMGAYDLAHLLFSKHTHAELCNSESIVYTEAGVISILKELGYPVPDFKTLAKSNKFLKGK